MKKILILSSAALLFAAVCVLNVNMGTKSISAKTSGIMFNKALADDESGSDGPGSLPPFIVDPGPPAQTPIDWTPLPPIELPPLPPIDLGTPHIP